LRLRVILAALVILPPFIILTLSGCDTALEAVVGQNPKNGAQTAPGAPPAPPSSASFMTGADLHNVYAGTGMQPPTLSFDDQGSTADEPGAPKGPNRPIAAAPLSVDSAKLAPLSAAVRRPSVAPDARFVLLVLAPPANDAAALDTTNAAARAAAAAALQALAGAGVQADRIELSMATNPTVGDGEIRLYLR
jgi:hypothetical protein